MPLRFGAHMGTSGGLFKAVTEGAAIGCETIQLFTSSPRQWKASQIAPDAVRKFRRAVESTGIYPLVAHDSYLINLASPDEALREKSRAAFLGEMERAEALGLDFLVTHLGSHMGAGEDAGLARLAESINVLHAQTPTYRVQIALETTAGKGTNLGGAFGHFKSVWAQVDNVSRLRVCLDTCHIFDAGYDVRTGETVGSTLDALDKAIGLSNLACIHANDSQKGLGSRADRHAHIGAGCIGNDGFVAFLTHPNLPPDLPVIIETGDSDTMHKVNVWHLRQLAQTAGAAESAA